MFSPLWILWNTKAVAETERNWVMVWMESPAQWTLIRNLRHYQVLSEPQTERCGAQQRVALGHRSTASTLSDSSSDCRGRHGHDLVVCQQQKRILSEGRLNLCQIISAILHIQCLPVNKKNSQLLQKHRFSPETKRMGGKGAARHSW